MGFLKRARNKAVAKEQAERLKNVPEMLKAKFLFVNKPILDTDKILTELQLYFTKVEHLSTNLVLTYFFPDIIVMLKDATVTAQCSIFVLDDTNHSIDIPEEAFQQNWHWKEANETARKCQYEVLITDFMTRTLDYKTRLFLFMNFLAGVVKAIHPQVIYSINSQKLMAPGHFIENWDQRERATLFGSTNVRLYNISNGDKGEILMDTIGLSSLGLPDFQLPFTGIDVNLIAELLWSYAYYIYEEGDVIKSGNTLQGLEPNSKWRCERQASLVGPKRIVIDVKPA